MKKLTKLLFAGFLALAVAPAAVLSLTSAKEPTQVRALDAGSVSVNNHYFTNTRLYYKNGASDVTDDSENYNACYDPTTATLTLNNYAGDSIAIGGSTAENINLKLVGNNTITTEEQKPLSNINGGGIYISAENTASLTIISTAGQSEIYGIYTSVAGNGKLDISGKANVSINVTSTRDDSTVYGAFLYGGVDVKDTASLTVQIASQNTLSGITVGAGLYAKGAIGFSTSSPLAVNASGIPSANGNIGVYSEDAVALSNTSELRIVVRSGGYAVPVYPGSSVSSWTEYKETLTTNEGVLTASYTPKEKFSVTYKANGGTGDDYVVNNILEGDSHNLVSVATAGFTAPVGQQFKCWSVGGIERGAGYSQLVDENLIVNAVWEDIPVETYTVTYKANGGTGADYVVNDVAGSYTLLGLAATGIGAPEHKHFKAWLVNDVEKQPSDVITVTADTDVKAVWEDTTFTVSFAAGYGTGSMTPAQVVEGSQYPLPQCTFIAPEGQIFKAWRVGADETDRQPGYEITVTANVTVVAQWKDAVEKFTVTYKANGGIGNDYVVSDIDSGSQHELVSLATAGFTAPSGKEFKCWSIGGEEKAPGTEITVDANKTVLAVWKDSQVDPEKTLVSITLSGNQKTEFTVGDAFSAEGLVVTAHYSDDSSEVIALNNVEISGYNMNQEGKQTITVSYQGKTATYEITVKAKDTPVTPDDPVTPNKSSGLPAGAVVGIVIGSALVVGVGGFALVWFVIKKKTWADFLALFKKK